MSNFLPTLTHPGALILAPASWFLLWLLYRSRQRNSYWQQKLPVSFQPWLLQHTTTRQHMLPWFLSALSAALASLALAGPGLPSQAAANQYTPDPLVIILELTPDMLASDLPPSRLHQMRNKALHLLNTQLPGQTGMVVYAGSAHTLLPLSLDPEMADNLLQALHPSLMPLPGRNAAAAVGKALELLQQGANGHGRIALLTRGLSMTEQQDITQLLGNHPIRLGIIGVGTPPGAPVPALDGGAFDSNQPLSELEEESLQKFARQQNIGYARLQHNNFDLLQAGLFAMGNHGQLQTSSVRSNDQGYWLLPLILLLLAPLGRKGWLPLLCLWLPASLLPLPTLAGSPPDRMQHTPDATRQQLQDPIWLGIAAYHAGDYALASQHFAKVSGPIAHYNRGNSLMRLGQYAAAAAAYQLALTLQPDLIQASDNLALALQLQQSTSRPTGQQPVGHSVQTQGTTSSTSQDEKTATLQLGKQDFEYGSLDSWLQQIPDNPAALLKRKFLHELSQSAP